MPGPARLGRRLVHAALHAQVSRGCVEGLPKFSIQKVCPMCRVELPPNPSSCTILGCGAMGGARGCVVGRFDQGAAAGYELGATTAAECSWPWARQSPAQSRCNVRPRPRFTTGPRWSIAVVPQGGRTRARIAQYNPGGMYQGGQGVKKRHPAQRRRVP